MLSDNAKQGATCQCPDQHSWPQKGRTACEVQMQYGNEGGKSSPRTWDVPAHLAIKPGPPVSRLEREQSPSLAICSKTNAWIFVNYSV